MEWILIYLAIKYKGYFYDVYNALKSKEIVSVENICNIKEQLETKKIQAITILDDEYPEKLKTINNPPFVIFYKGNINLLNLKLIMFTGEFTNDLINNFVDKSTQEISKNYALVSNNFKELDKRIITNFLKKEKPVILVSSNGVTNPDFKLDVNFFNENNNILIVSEFPDGVSVNKKRIAQRNRLAIGLSSALIIASSYKNSGIMNLVTHSLEQGKDVYCYPGLQNEFDGNNILIQEGAHLITSIKSIVN